MDKTINNETGEYVFSILDAEESIKWENVGKLKEWQKQEILKTLDELAQLIEERKNRYKCM